MERKAAYYHGLHAALEDLYGHIPVDTLADGDDPSDKMPFRHLLKAAESIFKNKGYKPEMLAGPEGRRLINDIYDTFRHAVDEGIADNDIPESMARKLDRDTFMFSGFKAHHELNEVGLALRDRDGKVKGYDAFEHDVLKIHNTYNRNYLKSEYGFAVASSQMAAKWQDVEAGRGRYDLQYRTAGDDRVREEHAAMNGITLPSDDPFWDKYYPPNGWRCRCTAVEVNKGKFPVSDSKEAERIGDKATTHLDRFGNNKDKIFRFNPGKEGKVFPPKHPYGKVDKEVRTIVGKIVVKQEKLEQIALRRKEIKTIMADRLDQTIINPSFSQPIGFSSRGIKEFLNQPHAHIQEKNELLLNIGDVYSKALYLGYNPTYHLKGLRHSHIFEIEICGDKSWLIVREYEDGRCLLYSCSDNPHISKGLIKK